MISDEVVIKILANRLLAKNADRQIKQSVSYKEYAKISRKSSIFLKKIEAGEENSLEQLRSVLKAKTDLKAKYKKENADLLGKRKEFNRNKEELLDQLTQENREAVEKMAAAIKKGGTA